MRLKRNVMRDAWDVFVEGKGQVGRVAKVDGSWRASKLEIEGPFDRLRLLIVPGVYASKVDALLALKKELDKD